MATTINAHLYKVTDTINNLFYVGKHNGIEQKGYWGSGRKWLKYIKEVGTNNLKYEILAIGNIDYIFDIERQYVTLDFIKNNSNCMNIRSGGHGNSQLSEETKQKLREAITLEIRQKLRMVHLGKKKSPEHIAKTSASRKGKTPWNKGIPATEEAKKNQSLAKIGKVGNRIGKKNSPEHIEKVRLSKLGTKASEETKLKLSLAHKGRKHILVECPHCNKKGGSTAMPRWHFDNCKLKEN